MKIRTFKLIDREGFLGSDGGNEEILDKYLKDGKIVGIFDDGTLYDIKDPEECLILSHELEYFVGVVDKTAQAIEHTKHLINLCERELKVLNSLLSMWEEE